LSRAIVKKDKIIYLNLTIDSRKGENMDMIIIGIIIFALLLSTYGIYAVLRYKDMETKIGAIALIIFSIFLLLLTMTLKSVLK
jgi:uncharacterized membrane protein YdcZ (DUF606 family)